MNILKFIKEDEIGRTVTVGVSCRTYEVVSCGDDGYRISVYKGFVHENGVEYILSREHPQGYVSCFVENINGKTIDRYTAAVKE